MGTQRMIEFETTSEEGAAKVNEALAPSFGVLVKEAPDGVSLTHGRVRNRRRFPALGELAEEGSKPLMDIGVTRDLPQVTGEGIEGGYPGPEVVERIGSYGPGL